MSDIYLSITETPAVVTLSQPVVSGALAGSVTVTNVVSVNVVTMPAITVQAAAPSVTTVAGSVSISNIPATQTIAGTVTANVWGEYDGNSYPIPLFSVSDYQADKIVVAAMVLDQNGKNVFSNQGWANSVTIGSLPAISGTVTANLPPVSGFLTNNVQLAAWDDEASEQVNLAYYNYATGEAWLPTKIVAGSVTIGSLPVQLSTTTIGGTARLNVTLSSATTVGGAAPSYANLYGGSDGTNLRAISVDTSGRTVVTGSVSLTSTTVTVSALPSGALTTRFGSVTTANTAQITSAVTNTSRKYLLAQNISSGTVTIGIGFSPTTTQGIQLTAGAGISFDSFCPTGAVYWLGATTGATFTILEG